MSETHLCLSCQRVFAECISHPTFASETDDRVVDCNAYWEDYDKMTVSQLRAVYNWHLIRRTLNGCDPIVDDEADTIFAKLKTSVLAPGTKETP